MSSLSLNLGYRGRKRRDASVLVTATTTVRKHHHLKRLLEAGVYWTSTSESVTEGLSGQELKQGWNLEAGADAEAMEECFLLTFSSWTAQPAFT